MRGSSPSKEAFFKADPDTESIAEVTPKAQKKKASRFELQLDHVLAYLNSDESLKSVGLHRLPGAAKVLKPLQATVEKNRKLAEIKPGKGSEHVATELLKHMFTVAFGKDGDTLLPAAVLEKLDTFLDRQPEGLASWLMAKLPPENRIAFTRILDHLAQTALHAGVNRMDVANLATVYGTKLAAPSVTDPLALASKGPKHEAVMKVLIERQIQARQQA